MKKPERILLARVMPDPKVVMHFASMKKGMAFSSGERRNIYEVWIDNTSGLANTQNIYQQFLPQKLEGHIFELISIPISMAASIHRGQQTVKGH